MRTVRLPMVSLPFPTVTSSACSNCASAITGSVAYSLTPSLNTKAVRRSLPSSSSSLATEPKPSALSSTLGSAGIG